MRTETWLAAVLCGCSVALGAVEPFRIHARFDFDADTLKHYRSEIYYGTPVAPNGKDRPSIFTKSWSGNAGERRLKMTRVADGYGGGGGALEVEENADSQVFYLLGFGAIPSHPGLKVAFCLRLPDGHENEMQIYIGNPVLKKNMETMLSLEPGRWHYVKHVINGPGYFADGVPVNNFGIESRRGGMRSWRIDNLVLWSGQDPEPPSRVAGVAAVADQGGISVTWHRATDNLFVVKYRIYRGTVSGFPSDQTTEIGETASLSFKDTALMHRCYYYTVRAEDCDGNLSEPSPAILSRPQADGIANRQIPKE